MHPVVVGIGEVLWDVLPEGKEIGGAPANFAYHVSQFGLDSQVVSAIGKDKSGEEIIDNFNSKRLKHYLPETDFPTGRVEIELNREGIPAYNIKRNVAWDNIPFTEDIEALSKRTTTVCFGTLAQRNAVSRNTIHRFLEAMPNKNDVLKVFDINLRQGFHTKEIIIESLRMCNVLKINDEELTAISSIIGNREIDFKESCRWLVERYDLRLLILTCGINGSYVFAPGKVSFQPTPKVKVEDTVGAGDSFAAAFVSSIIKGHTIEEAHKKAAEVSAFVCTQKGAMPLLPKEFTQI